VGRSWKGPAQRRRLRRRQRSAAAPRGAGLRRDAEGWGTAAVAGTCTERPLAPALSVRRFQRFYRGVAMAVEAGRRRGLYGAHQRVEEPRAVDDRSYHSHLRQFLEYAADPRYEWVAVCERMFGTHPADLFRLEHRLPCAGVSRWRPARRALTKASCSSSSTTPTIRSPLPALRQQGLAQAMRDSAALKTAYHGPAPREAGDAGSGRSRVQPPRI